MNARVCLLACTVAALGVAVHAQQFNERWETAALGVRVPPDLIDADEGVWFLGDTVSEFPECGPTPQIGEILSLDGSRALFLESNESFSDCADDVWVALAEFDSFNTGFGIPINTDTIVSFEEVGELIDPQLRAIGLECPFPPCYDNVSLLLTDNNNNILAYVLQRFPDAVENAAADYREIFLDPNAVTYRRNLLQDFQTIAGFEPQGARIEFIEFRVDELGSAILDNLFIGPAAVEGTVPVYRFWSPVLGCHFFTAKASEMQKLLETFADIWTFERIAFYALPDDTLPDAAPVYRFWSPVLKAHFYTIREGERDKLIINFPDVWTFEGIAFYAFPPGSQPAETQPVFRFFSPVLGCHFFTISERERDKLLDRFSDIWLSEGVAWNAYLP